MPERVPSCDGGAHARVEQGRARSPENGHASSDGKKRPRDLRKQRRRGQGETNPGLFEAYGFTVAEDRPGKPTSQILAPNDVWSADYKGQFRTGDGRYCYPL